LFRVAVPVLPRVSNHTDFDALRGHPQVDLQFVGPGQPIPAADMIILPGSKNTCADLAWLMEQGWDDAVRQHVRYGGKLIGICGGYQMLGADIADPHGVEGAATGAVTAGLGLLDLHTELTREKTLQEVSGQCAFADAAVKGYEIHMGRSQGAALATPAFFIDGRGEGALSADGRILGTYLHGLFDHPEACAALLRWGGLHDAAPFDIGAAREASIERIADACEPLFQALVNLKSDGTPT